MCLYTFRYTNRRDQAGGVFVVNRQDPSVLIYMVHNHGVCACMSVFMMSGCDMDIRTFGDPVIVV